MTASASSRGAVIGDRYVVRGPLGSGSCGEVYEVWDRRLHHVAALKLLPQISPVTAWRESAILTQLRGEFVLPVWNAGLDQGVPFIVSDLAVNGTLADQIKTRAGVPVSSAAKWVQQACRGISRVHDLRLLHNDIKPANIFLGSNGEALVGDFGLACEVDANGNGRYGGTVTTMAPEVAHVGSTVPAGNRIHHRPTSVASDVFSLGATLYELIAGVPWFVPSGDRSADFHTAARGEPPRLIDVAPHCPPGLARIVEQAMARVPSDRFATPAAFDAAIGGRARTSRQWVRQSPHPGHTDCYVSKRLHHATILVCAVPTGTATRHVVEIWRGSPPRRVKPWPESSRSSLPRTLRTVFRRYS